MVTFLVLIIAFLVVVSAFAAIQVPSSALNEPFYVGVTYCGDSIAEAKQLIDEVKNYTNLFVLQSGYLMTNGVITEIGDYAVNAGLKFMFYFGDSSGPATTANVLVRAAEDRWNSRFLGVYYKDEPGGKMLDKKGIALRTVYTTAGVGSIYRNPDGSVSVPSFDNNTFNSTTFFKTGVIEVHAQKNYPFPSEWVMSLHLNQKTN